MRLLAILAIGLTASSTFAQQSAGKLIPKSNSSSGLLTDDVFIYFSGSKLKLPSLSAWTISGIVLAVAWRHHLDVQWLSFLALPALAHAEGTTNLSIATVAGNATHSDPNEKGGDGGGDAGHGAGTDGDGEGGSAGGGGSGSGGGAIVGGGHATSDAKRLLVPKEMIAAAIFAIVVQKAPELLPLALLALPAFTQAEVTLSNPNINESAIHLHPNQTNDNDGGSGGGGALLLLSNARSFIAPKQLVASTVLASIAYQHFGLLPLAFLLLPELSFADATPRREMIQVPRAIASVTEFVQYNLSGFPQTLTYSGQTSTTTTITNISTRTATKIVVTPVTPATVLKTSESSSSFATSAASTSLPSGKTTLVAGTASSDLQCWSGLTTLMAGLAVVLLCHVA